MGHSSIISSCDQYIFVVWIDYLVYMLSGMVYLTWTPVEWFNFGNCFSDTISNAVTIFGIGYHCKVYISVWQISFDLDLISSKFNYAKFIWYLMWWNLHKRYKFNHDMYSNQHFIACFLFHSLIVVSAITEYFSLLGPTKTYHSAFIIIWLL